MADVVKEKSLGGQLAGLTVSIEEMIDKAKATGEIQAEEELQFRWKVDNFQYTDNGISGVKAHAEYPSKRIWFRASRKILEQVKQTAGYTSLVESLRPYYEEDKDPAVDAESFVQKVIDAFLNPPEKRGPQIDSIIINFLADLDEEPVKYGAEVELEGIILRSKSIDPAFGIELRQPRIEDLEKETPAYMPSIRSPFLPNPSAFLRIEFLGRGVREVQIRIYQAITILRLFRVGSVKYVSYRTFSDSVMDRMAGGILSAGARESALEKYLVTVDDEPKLRKFWQAIFNTLPSSLLEFEQTKADHVTIAYTRYSDALLQNGLTERRIANAIMGMESLYLKGGETQELVYRLCLRSSKLLRILGFDHHDVRRHLADAYRIRNLFAHGSQLGYKDRRKLDLKYKDLKNLLLTVLDYLRISIVSVILLRKGKDELIDILDDSLIDDQKQQLLSSWLSSAKDLLS